MNCMFSNNINKVNIYCWLLYAIYAVFSLTILGYGVYFLESLGFPYITIGLTIAISALVSSIIQPLIGRFADIKQYSWKNILIMLNLIMLFSALGLFVAPKSILIILFSLMVIVLGCIYPFLNTGVFYYGNYGIETNFGVSRGFASISYMIFAALFGFLNLEVNVMIINIFSVLAAIAMLVVLNFLPYYGSIISEKTSKSFKNNVLLKYPTFTLIFIAVALFMVFHHIFLCYMINFFENVGGGISDVSFVNSLGALLEIPIMFMFAFLLRKFSVKILILFASICYVLRALVIYFAHDPMGLYLSLILHMLTFAIIIPASVHFADDILDEEDKHEGQAFMGATITIGLIFANFIGGNVLHYYDIHLLLTILVIVPLLGAICSFSTLLLDK